MDQLWSPWRFQYVTRGPSGTGKSDCVLCQISTATDDAEALVLHRAEYNFVVLNRYPYSSGHLMVVPYFHAATLGGVNDDTAAEMMQLTRRAEHILTEVYNPAGLNLGMNIGESAGAGVAGHIHMHVLPRWPGDVNFMTAIGETRILPEELGVTFDRLSVRFRGGL